MSDLRPLSTYKHEGNGCRNGLTNQPACRTRAAYAHELRIQAALGAIPRAECDSKLAALGVAADPVAEAAARMCADARRAKAAGTFNPHRESEYGRRAAVGKLGR